MPDHDFVAGSKYKLLPSVIGHIKVVNSKDLTNDTVSDSGPTLIVRRSAKHSVFFWHTPGGSAFSRVERIVSNLSEELSGINLPHYNFGTQLDSFLAEEGLELKF